jgi:hypothetical protein
MSANLAPGSDIVLELDAAGVIQSIALGTSVGASTIAVVGRSRMD